MGQLLHRLGAVVLLLLQLPWPVQGLCHIRSVVKTRHAAFKVTVSAHSCRPSHHSSSAASTTTTLLDDHDAAATVIQNRLPTLAVSKPPARSSTAIATASALLLTVLLVFCFATPTWAAKEKNEALCGTGFFTNIYQYKCTDIGDIEQDGKVQPLTNKELSRTDSLLDKLSLSSFDDETTKLSPNNNNNDESKQKQSTTR